MTAPRRYIESAAILSGWPAYVFARLLKRCWPDTVEDYPVYLRKPLEDALEALEYAGKTWTDARTAAARGSAEVAPAETPADSTWRVMGEVLPEELSTAEVADMLQVTERRVRQLGASGALTGRQKAGRWTFDRGAVTAYRERMVHSGR